MYLEAITTCVGFGDFLAESLPLNRHFFDYYVVVTSPDDLETQKLCEYWKVHCVVTDEFGTQDGEFWKGKGINVGLNQLSKKGWVVQLDADIVLPPLTRHWLNEIELDPTMIYGIDRFLMQSPEKWQEHCRKPKLQQENNAYVHIESYDVGTRFVTTAVGGYIPIGFFQLWNPQATGIATYPAKHNGAGRTDYQFAQQWPRLKRGFLPEIIAYHLESEKAPQGINWSGRKTARMDERPPWWKLCKRWHHWRHYRRHHHHNKCHHHHCHHHHHPDPPPPDPYFNELDNHKDTE